MNFLTYNFFENSNKKRIEIFCNFNYIIKIISCSIFKIEYRREYRRSCYCSFSFIIYQLEIIAF